MALYALNYRLDFGVLVIMQGEHSTYGDELLPALVIRPGLFVPVAAVDEQQTDVFVPGLGHFLGKSPDRRD